MEVRMRKPCGAILFCFIALPLAHAKEANLPNSCGSASTKFSVQVAKPGITPPNLTPPPGKALFVFIEVEKLGGWGKAWLGLHFGFDGAWVGATEDKSYFVTPVDPGAHHLCVMPTHSLNTIVAGIHTVKAGHVEEFNAEAGQIYFFAGTIYPSGPFSNSLVYFYTFLGEEQGWDELKVSGLATAKFKEK
jgi:hypothetical protein